jgi:multimeric flavodoxin WrbA
MIEDYVKREHGNNIEVETVRFTDYDFKPCIMCGGCAREGKCLYDEAFNILFSKMAAADGIILVCPHYATIPSKLMMVLEKLEEMTFISYCLKKESYALSGKPVAVIGHGGMT